MLGCCFCELLLFVELRLICVGGYCGLCGLGLVSGWWDCYACYLFVLLWLLVGLVTVIFDWCVFVYLDFCGCVGSSFWVCCFVAIWLFVGLFVTD